MDLAEAVWRKATISGDGGGGGCVEVAMNLSEVVAVRDSKDSEGPVLVFTPYEWACFLDGARRGEFDL